ncbi:hypothetical protein V3C33_14185 [Micrococcaceae bacterium Sec5.7]
MPLIDFVLALCALLGSLLLPFSVLYLMLRLKRRAAVSPAQRRLAAASAPSRG